MAEINTNLTNVLTSTIWLNLISTKSEVSDLIRVLRNIVLHMTAGNEDDIIGKEVTWSAENQFEFKGLCSYGKPTLVLRIIELFSPS